jgi:hypothetical protein
MPVASIQEIGMTDDLRKVHRCRNCGELMIATPLIKCSHCDAEVPIRCFTFKSGKHFYAQCLDLNLLSRGDTEEEAIGRLQESMFAYVVSAFDGDPSGLIPRRAPLGSWVRYFFRHSIRTAKWLFKRRDSRHQVHFEVPNAAKLSHCP